MVVKASKYLPRKRGYVVERLNGHLFRSWEGKIYIYRTRSEADAADEEVERQDLYDEAQEKKWRELAEIAEEQGGGAV